MKAEIKNNLQVLCNSAAEIVIISGEGDEGTREPYTGKRTPSAVWRTLAKEWSNGDRWAYVTDSQRFFRRIYYPTGDYFLGE